MRKQWINKKVLLCERKRHTARPVASTCCAVPVRVSTHPDLGPDLSCPDLGWGTSPSWDGVPPVLTWDGVPYLADRGVPPSFPTLDTLILLNWGGVSPILTWDLTWMGGYPLSWPWMGYLPILGWGTPCPDLGWGTLSGWQGGTPFLPNRGYPHPSQLGRVPPCWEGRCTPVSQIGYPPPPRNVDRQTSVKTVPSPFLRNAGGKKWAPFLITHKQSSSLACESWREWRRLNGRQIRGRKRIFVWK